MVSMTRLLATKLSIPRVRSALVVRERLLERLTQGIEGKLTLISALPGSGKTTLMSEWQMTTRDNPFPLCWVSLDESDNDITNFWSYVAKAIETLSTAVSEDTLTLLHSFPNPPIEAVLITLLNAITSTIQGDFGLVLDDYHCIENESIHTSLTFFLDHLPSQMHLILITRADPPLPLSRLRVRGQLTEIRTADLRFTPLETAEFLNQTMQLKVSSHDAAHLTERTEGWIAGLQLAALSLQRQEPVTALLSSFNGNHRYILEYLTQEVVEHLPPHIQSFLQDTAILGRLSAAVCNAVTGRTDSQEILLWLEKANLFLISLDEVQQWYRYHALFRDFLQNSLRATKAEAYTKNLHLRAASWYEQHSLLNEAVHHMLASGDFEQAAQSIERIARAVWMHGEATTLQCWLQALPEPVLHAHPQLGLFSVWSYIASNQLDRAKKHLDEVKTSLQRDPSQFTSGIEPESSVMQTEIIILQATIARFLHDISATIALSQQAEKYIPRENAILHSINTLNLGHAYHLQGKSVDASAAFKHSITLGRAAGNIYTVLLALNNLIQLSLEQGSLRSATLYCQESLNVAARHGCEHLPIMSLTAIKEGEILYEQNNLVAAAQKLQHGISLAQPNSIRFLLQGQMALARLFHAQGADEQAHEHLVEARTLAQAHSSSLLIQHIAALQARLWLSSGKLSRAFSWLKSSPLHVEDNPEYAYEFEYLTLVRLLMAQGKSKEVISLLERLRLSATSGGRTGSVMEIFWLQALANFAHNQPTEAFTALTRALSLTAPEGYTRLFLDEGERAAQVLTRFAPWLHEQSTASSTLPTDIQSYVDTLLTTFTLNASKASKAPLHNGKQEARSSENAFLVEALGERESEVLRLLAAGLSNQAIAEEMVVAVSTVKSHLKSIYRKLDVDSRTHAIAKARELHLL